MKMKLSFRLILLIIAGIVVLPLNVFPQSESGVVASAHPLASQAGIEILKQEGNAVDAAVAAAFTLGVVEPYASGIGGGGFLTVKMHDGEAVTIDYREKAPTAAQPGLFYSEENNFKLITTVGAKASGVPGTLAGLALVLEKFGTMNLEQVLRPAIEIARNGYEISQTMYDVINEEYGVISQFDETAALYLNEGLPYDAGHKLKNPELASTYEKIAGDGIESFYEKEIAGDIAACMKNYGGLITADDLKNYKPLIKKPVTGFYKGYEIISSAPPSGGGTHLDELMNILENADLVSLGHNSAGYIHLFAEAISIVQTDKAFYMGDPGFVDVPVEKLTDKKYARQAFEAIEPDTARLEWLPGGPEPSESGSTTSLSVVDKDGNLITVTQSLNLFFGSGITVPGRGILMNNHMDNFDPEPGRVNSIGPGRRPVSSIAPTILLKDGKPVLTIGTPGGSRIIGTLAQILVNIIDFGMPLEEAISSPRFHAVGQKIHLENRIPEETVEKLKRLGHEIELHSAFDKYFGGAQAVMVDIGKNTKTGAADMRREGSVLAY